MYYALHPSLEPEVLGLYSINKLIGIIVLFFTGILINSLLKILIKKKYIIPRFISEKRDLNVFYIFLFILCLSFIISLNHPLGIGTDFAEQLKSAQQWQNNESNLLNNIVTRNIKDLQLSNTSWSARPPGAMIYYIPFLYIPIKLGTSLILANFLLCLIIGYCWIKIVQSASQNVKVHIAFSIIMGIWLSTNLFYLGNIQTLVNAYSSVMSLIIFNALKNNKFQDYSFTNFVRFSIIFLILGSIVWIKISAIIYTGTLAFIFLLSMVLNITKIELKINLLFKRAFIILIFSIIFLLPIIFLFILNRIMDVDTNSVYAQNYNETEIVKLHWGEFYTETTRFPVILFSMLSSWSTFGPFAYFQTLISNAFSYLGIGDNFFNEIQLNSKLMWKNIFGILCSMVMIMGFLNLKIRNKHNYLLVITLLSLPFFVFMFISAKNGYNFLMSGTYSDQYMPSLILLSILIIVNATIRNTFANKCLKTLILVPGISFFAFSQTKYITNHIVFPFHSNKPSHNHIYHPFFGQRINTIIDKVNLITETNDVPIIYLTNSSVYEISIFFNVPFCSTKNFEKNLDQDLPFINKTMTPFLLLIDSRLEISKVIKSFNNMKYLTKKTIINEKDSAAVYFFDYK